MARKQTERSGLQVSREQVLRRRAQRFAHRGQHRKAALVLREAVAMTGDAPGWTRLGAMLRRAGRTSDALHAFRQALFQFRREGQPGRSRTLARLIIELDPGDHKAARLAA